MAYPAQEHFPDKCRECPTLVGMIEDGVFSEYPLEPVDAESVKTIIETDDPEMARWLSTGRCVGRFALHSEQNGQPTEEIGCGKEFELKF